MVRSDSHLRTQRSFTRHTAKWPLYRWFIPKLDACLAAGQWSRDYFLHYGASADRVFIVPHVVDTDYFRWEGKKLKPQRLSLRANWGVDSDSIVFLFAGKFTEIKRPLDFVRAVGYAARNGTPIKGLMVGDGPLRAACEQFARANDFPICFADFLNQSQIAKAYVAADVLVLPSSAETWGVVVNEAMACGLPCIVSDRVGCGPDMIVCGQTGHIFPMGDVASLAGLMHSIEANRELLALMSQQATSKAANYSLSVGVESVVGAMAVATSTRTA